ncbi:MAG TPA: VOC family protein [Acidimicrobiales bacterium]|nr:VOC family protein [Acidimicrobiales bacterium]
MAELTAPEDDMVLCHFIVSDDVERSRRFYTEVLGGRVVFSGDVTSVNVVIEVGQTTDPKGDWSPW